ncbi:MAG: restriction endonuclease subunit S [Pseudomonadota bacterium]
MKIENSPLPDGWEIKKLGEVAKINYGYTEKASFTEIGPKFLRITDIKDNGVEWSSVPYCECSDLDLPKYQLEEADIVFARTGATTGKSYLVKNPPKAVFASYLIRLKLISKEDFSSEFVSYYFQTQLYWDKINEGISGSAQGGFNATKLGQLIFPIPPLPEQKRIVAILDKAFAAIAKAKANAEQNLKNAKELFESYLQGVFENKGEGWEEKKLNEITEVKDGTHDSPKYVKDGIPFVTQKNIKPDGLTIENTKFITEVVHEKFYKRSNVTYGDILISMIGANRGMACIVDDKRIFSIKNVGLIKKTEKINNYFLLHYLKSTLAMKYVLYMSNGGAQEFVGLTALRSFPIPLPSLEEQQTIVQKLDALSAETKKLEAIYLQKTDDLEELKKSILQKAFNGEL